MSTLSDPALRRILDAALSLFAAHGFQRTSMADIAREAQIARATLYLRFKDKRAVFATLAETLVADALAAAEAAWQDGAPFAANVAATLLAKDLPFYRLEHATPHGAELLHIDTALTQIHTQHLDTAFTALLTRRAMQAEEAHADLSIFGGAKAFAHFLAVAGAGLKHEIQTETAYLEAVACLSRVVERACNASLPI